MTRERAAEILKMRQCCRECVVAGVTCEECDEAFRIAIEALFADNGNHGQSESQERRPRE